MRNKIKISGKQLSEMIAKSVSAIINEGGTNMQSLYHFTDIEGFCGIVKTDSFNLGEQKNLRNNPYMSLTRHKSRSEGYAMPNESLVRIEIDATKLNSIHGGNTKPFEFYSPKNTEKLTADGRVLFGNQGSPNISAKEKYAKQVKEPYNRDLAEYLNQAEESYENSKLHYLPASKIIKRVDIYVSDTSWYFTKEEADMLVELSDSIDNPIVRKTFTYEDENQFNLQSSKCTPLVDWAINRTLNKYIAESAVQEMAYPVGFDMKELKSLTSYAARLNYCTQRLQKIGVGSSRVVFAVDDEKVLKVAKNKKGLAQNQEEMQDWRQNYYDCFAKVYDASEDGIFLEMQAARKAKNSDFKRLTGYGFDVMCAWIEYTASLYLPRNRFRPRNTKYDGLFDSGEWSDGLDNYNLFERIYNYLCDTCTEAYGDYCRLSSWGVVSEDGEEKLVLIDFGLTDEIFDTYYKR